MRSRHSFCYLFEPLGDAAHGVLADSDPAQRLGDVRDLPNRAPEEIHLEDRLFHIAGHALVAFEDLGEELALTVAGHLQVFDLAAGVIRLR